MYYLQLLTLLCVGASVVSCSHSDFSTKIADNTSQHKARILGNVYKTFNSPASGFNKREKMQCPEKVTIKKNLFSLLSPTGTPFHDPALSSSILNNKSLNLLHVIAKCQWSASWGCIIRLPWTHKKNMWKTVLYHLVVPFSVGFRTCPLLQKEMRRRTCDIT